jgi:hypothetical protein
MLSNQSAHTELMRAMGGHDGYNPIPPRCHRFLMDADQPEQTRGIAWVFWRTFDFDPKSKSGPAKKTRTPIAHDTRVSAKRHLEVRHAAEDLGMTVSNAWAMFRRLEGKGQIAIDEEGRISLRADAPDPRRIKTEDDGEGSEPGGEPESLERICTDSFQTNIHLCFQQLDENRRRQYARLYRTMPAPVANHLQALDPEPRAVHTWRYLQACAYKEQLEADAIAAARAMGRPVVEKVLAEAGFVDTEPRGRKEVRRGLTIDLKARGNPEILAVPGIRTDSNSTLYTGKNGSVQSGASLLSLQREQSKQSEVSAGSVEKSESADASSPPATPLNPRPRPSKVTSATAPGAISAWVEAHFGRRIDNRLRASFDDLPARFQIPARSTIRFLQEKVKRKKADHYPVVSPGALHRFAAKDLPGWIHLNRLVLSIDHEAEQRAREAPPEPPPFDPAEYTKALAKELAMTKGKR